MKMKLSAFLLCAALTLFTLSACKSQPEPAADNSSNTESAENAGDVDAAFHHTTDNYAVTLSHAKDGKRELIVVPKGVYKINLEYPWKFVDSEKATLKRDAFTLKEPRATLALPEKTLKGSLSFSVCSDVTCLLEKVEVKGE